MVEAQARDPWSVAVNGIEVEGAPEVAGMIPSDLAAQQRHADAASVDRAAMGNRRIVGEHTVGKGQVPQRVNCAAEEALQGSVIRGSAVNKLQTIECEGSA